MIKTVEDKKKQKYVTIKLIHNDKDKLSQDEIKRLFQ